MSFTNIAVFTRVGSDFYLWWGGQRFLRVSSPNDISCIFVLNGLSIIRKGELYQKRTVSSYRDIMSGNIIIKKNNEDKSEEE